MRFGLGLGFSRGGAVRLAVAPPYVEPDPEEDPPEDPPEGDPSNEPIPDDPDPPPTDPDTEEPEPAVDPDFVAADRIELEDGRQTVVRTPADPGTWGNAYVNTEADGYDYWEVHVGGSVKKGSTIAIGVTNTTLPLNGVPGALPGTVAYWSDGTVRHDDDSDTGFATYGKNSKIMIARDRDTGRVWFGLGGSWLGSTPSVGGSGHQGTVTGAEPYFPFVALYSEGSKVTFKFIESKFAYGIPDGFYPLGQTPEAGPSISQFTVLTNTGSKSPTSTTYEVPWDQISEGGDGFSLSLPSADIPIPENAVKYRVHTSLMFTDNIDSYVRIMVNDVEVPSHRVVSRHDTSGGSTEYNAVAVSQIIERGVGSEIVNVVSRQYSSSWTIQNGAETFAIIEVLEAL